MKVMAINSSPRPAQQSKTGMMLGALVEGLREAGAEVDLVELRDKHVKFCLGCYACWTKTPGRCIQRDDMTRELYPQWLASDMAVYATPLYNDGLSAAMKVFVERTLPSYEPWLDRRNGRTHHPLRGHHPAIVILSVAGMPEPANFDLLSAHVNYTFRKSGKRLWAEIYRPAAESLAAPSFAQQRADVLEATRQAGRELVETSAVSEKTLARIAQPLADPEVINEGANRFWRILIEARMTPREFFSKRAGNGSGPKGERN
ncbi:MAG: flavodoxin family protein [Proteobacteria bacterium]|nr:flavodoxin family protein [Pseudomonadota bacterium]